MSHRQIPEPTISRISLYLRTLRNIVTEDERKLTVSSSELAKIINISSDQIRKDLSYFDGEIGKPGRGYIVSDLITHLEYILNLDSPKRVMIAGIGNLGSALSGYDGFRRGDFMLSALFDNNPQKIGTVIHDLTVNDIKDIVKINEKLNIKVGILSVSADVAEEVAQAMADSGVKVILNFAPTHITPIKDVMIRNVDLTKELQVLSFYL